MLLFCKVGDHPRSPLMTTIREKPSKDAASAMILPYPSMLFSRIGKSFSCFPAAHSRWLAKPVRKTYDLLPHPGACIS